MSDNAKKSVTEIVGVIVNELSSLEAADRRRVIQAVFALLGDDPPSLVARSEVTHPADNDDRFSPRAKAWMKQNELSSSDILQVFHPGIDGVEIIAAEIPGTNNREKVRNAYVMLGIGKLLSSGESLFDDREARAVCERFGIYDQTNHSKYMKAGNEFVGSKERGWTVTAPGLKHGGKLIKELAVDTKR